MAAASADAQAYAEALRKSLTEGMFDGEELEAGAAGDGGAGADAAGADGGGLRFSGAGGSQLAGVEQDLEAFGSHELVAVILDKGLVPSEHSGRVEGALAAAELGSIQDYISEADNLVALHEQVGAEGGGGLGGAGGGRCACLCCIRTAAQQSHVRAGGRGRGSAELAAPARLASRNPAAAALCMRACRRAACLRAPRAACPAWLRRSRAATRCSRAWRPCWAASRPTWAPCPERSARCR